VMQISGQFFISPEEWPGEFPAPIGGGSLT
jgi:hypothetical protein